MSAQGVDIAPFTGPRMELRSLFELAEDSATALDASLDDGIVLVARTDGAVVGHLQLTFLEDRSEAEIKNMAVVEPQQGKGIGRSLVAAAVAAASDAGATRLLVATAAADVGNLRFYQRQGFRLRAVDRDAFTAATGYPGPIVIDGIELRDRVWLDRALAESS
jgi:GNAT superfamily N-acetyltransferase